MEILPILKLIVTDSIPIAILLIFLVAKFNMIEHKMKDLRSHFDIYIRDNYITRDECNGNRTASKVVKKINTRKSTKWLKKWF